jgi:protein ImuA
MLTSKAAILAQLQKDLLPLQGFKPAASGGAHHAGLGPINNAFPTRSFPLGAVHEFLCSGAEEAAASSGFIAGVLSSLMLSGGITVWISATRTLFPPALQAFNIQPHKIIFIDLKRESDLLWVMEEALKCGGLAAVVGEVKELSFTTSRRLQLAVESSGVTGFLLRRDLRTTSTVCITRWRIAPLASETEEGLPGLGFPRWQVQLVKVRNGTPGTWQMEWVKGSFRTVYRPAVVLSETLQKQTG